MRSALTKGRRICSSPSIVPRSSCTPSRPKQGRRLSQGNAVPTTVPCSHGTDQQRRAVSQVSGDRNVQAPSFRCFDLICHRHRIEHRRTQTYHPWINGQVERMNRTLRRPRRRPSTTLAWTRYQRISEARMPRNAHNGKAPKARELAVLRGFLPRDDLRGKNTGAPGGMIIKNLSH